MGHKKTQSSEEGKRGQRNHPSPPHEGVQAATIRVKSTADLATSPREADEAAKAQFLWQTHQYLNEYVRFADTKAAFAGAIASTLLGAMYTAKAHLPLLSKPFQQWPLSCWLTVVAALLLAAVVAFAILAVRPRLRTTEKKGFIYWGNIAAHGSVDVLKSSFHGQSARTLNDHVLHHIFDVSSVSVPKYRLVSLAITTLAIGGILAVSALILNDVPKPVQIEKPATVRTSQPPKPVPAVSGER